MRIIRHRAWARAGLLGNPSDGYHGKTIAFTLRNFSAQVVLYPWDRLEIVWSRQDKNSFASIEELVDDVRLNGYYGGVRLIKATIKRFYDYSRDRHDLASQPFSIRYETDIPRGVGLAGSSAIVVATLRCLTEYYDVAIQDRVLASLAHSVENDELGIACGLQDRVAQVYGGLVYMDFDRSAMESIAGLACGRYERLDAGGLPPLYIAYNPVGAETSDTVHGALRTRVQDHAELAATMQKIAALVPEARRAIEAGDHDRLHALVDRNFDLRCELYNIAPQHLAMVQTAREAGASAKFAGSGGTIVGTFRDEAAYERLSAALRAANPAWRLFRPELALPSTAARC